MLTHPTPPSCAALGDRPVTVRASVLYEVLRSAHAALAMMVEPGVVERTTILQAWAVAKAAEAKARKALASFEPDQPQKLGDVAAEAVARLAGGGK